MGENFKGRLLGRSRRLLAGWAKCRNGAIGHVDFCPGFDAKAFASPGGGSFAPAAKMVTRITEFSRRAKLVDQGRRNAASKCPQCDLHRTLSAT